jgi:hypothetical protein
MVAFGQIDDGGGVALYSRSFFLSAMAVVVGGGARALAGVDLDGCPDFVEPHLEACEQRG